MLGIVAVKRYLKFRVSVLLRRWFVYRPSSKRHVMLLGSRRSGTTLLAEVLAVNPGTIIVDEPLNLFQTTLCAYPIRQRELPHRPMSQFMMLDEVESERVANYLRDMMRLRWREGVRVRRYQLPLRCDRCVVKLVQGCGLIDWITQHMETINVYLIRHPASQALSVRHLGWSVTAAAYLENEAFVREYLTDAQRDFGDQVLCDGTDFEKYVLNWVLENLIALRFSCSSFFRVTYEELVWRPEKLLQALGEELQFEHVDAMLKQMNRPSNSSQFSRHLKKKDLERRHVDRSQWHGRLTRWQSELTEAECVDGQRILDQFQIDVYTMDSPWPSDDWLHFGAILQNKTDRDR